MAITGSFQKLYTFFLIPTTTFKNMYYYLQFTYEKNEIHKDTSLSQSKLTYDPLYTLTRPHPHPWQSREWHKGLYAGSLSGKRAKEQDLGT